MNYANKEWLDTRIAEHVNKVREFLVSRMIRASIVTVDSVDIRAVEAEVGNSYIAKQILNRSRKLVPEMVSRKKNANLKLEEAKQVYDDCVAAHNKHIEKEHLKRQQDNELKVFLETYAKLGKQEFTYTPDTYVLEWVTEAINSGLGYEVRKQPSAWFKRKAYNKYNENWYIVDEFYAFFCKYRDFFKAHLTDDILERMDLPSQQAYAKMMASQVDTDCIENLYSVINMIKGLRNTVKLRSTTTRLNTSAQQVEKHRASYKHFQEDAKQLGDVNYWASWLLDFEAFRYVPSDLVDLCVYIDYQHIDELKLILVCKQIGNQLDLEKISSIRRFVDDSSTNWDKMCKELLTRYAKES